METIAMTLKSILRFEQNNQEKILESEKLLFEKVDSSWLQNSLQCTSYLHSAQVVTVCREKVLRSVVNSCGGSRGDDSVGDCSGLSVEGSPLKLQQFDTPNSHSGGGTSTGGGGVMEAFIKPLPAREAREFLSELLRLSCTQEQPTLSSPLLAYCDGRGPECLALIGAALQPSTDQNHKHRCMSYKVTSRGPLRYSERDKLPRVSAIRNKYFPPHSKVDLVYRAEYEVLGCSSPQHDVSVTGQTALSLRVEWSTGSHLLQVPPLDSQTTVEAVVSAGDMRSAAHHFYLDLCALEGFTSGLEEGHVKWAADSSDGPLLDRVSALIEEVSRGDSVRLRLQHGGEEDPVPDTPTIKHHKLAFEERADLDFTEQLWNILKDCSCYEDMVSGLSLVFSKLQSGHLQPMVHKSNRCSLASLIRTSYVGEMASPALSGRRPLQLLVEIGAEKLSRDYMNAFIGKELAAASHLEHFVRGRCGGERGDPHERVVLLSKLQYTLELVAALSQYLDLPQSTLGTTARRLLKYLESHGVENSHVTHVPVSTSHVYSHIERVCPRVWQLEMSGHVTGHGEGPPLCCVFLLTQRPPFPHVTHSNRSHSESGAVPEDMERGDEDTSVYLTVASQNLLTL